MGTSQSGQLAAQLSVSPTEVLGLRALVRELEAEAVDRNKEIADLKNENAFLKKQIHDFHSSRPPPKVITRRPR